MAVVSSYTVESPRSMFVLFWLKSSPFMGSCRREKLAFDAFRSFACKVTAKSPFHNSIPAKFSAFSSSVSQELGFGLRTGVNRIHNNPYIVDVGKRFYCVDQYRVRRFSPRWPRRLFVNPRDILIALLVSSALFIIACGIIFYFGNLETVPYTNRKHLVLLSEQLDREAGEIWSQEKKAEIKGKILPAMHPDSVRVLLIAKSIIEGLQRDLGHESDLGVVDYASDGNEDTKKDDVILNFGRVLQSKLKDKETGSRPQNSHLDGLKWEVMVVDDPAVYNAVCLPGGKIVVYKRFLEIYGSDEEIATTLGHEVAHVVARHHAETISNAFWFQFLPDAIESKLAPFFQRRMEVEADYIGMMLVASAGYDPRSVPKFYEKMGKLEIETNTGDDNDLRSHPPGMMRAKLLSQAHALEEALSIYRETIE